MPTGNKPVFLGFPQVQPTQNNVQGQTYIPMFQTPNNIQGHAIFNNGIPSQMISSQPMQSLCPSQSNQYYIPPNQEQYLNMQQSSSNHSNTQIHNTLYSRMTSTSEDEDNTYSAQENPWQVVKGTKRRKYRSSKNAEEEISLNNKYTVLNSQTDGSNNNNNDGENTEISKPPPIFVYGVVNLPEMKKKTKRYN